MRTVHILEPFTGYPQGAKEGSKGRDFVKGEEPEVSNEFADLVIGKGLAREAAPAEQDAGRDAPAGNRKRS